MAERLQVREIDDDEGRRLMRIVRRDSGSVVTAAGADGTAVRYASSYGDYDVYVHSNQPDKSVTASGGGYSHSYYTDGSGYADVYLRGPQPGQQITVTVGGATCSTTA